MPLDAELGYAIPRDALAALIRRLGGTVQYIPQSPAGRSFSELAKAIGEDHAQRLVSLAGGDQLYVPCGLDGCREQRHVVIRALAERGLSAHTIARDFAFVERVTERHVRRILAESR